MRAWTVWGSIVVLPIAVFLALDRGLVPDPSWMVPELHFFIVSLTSFVALLLASFMVIAASQLHDARVIFLSLAFLGISGVFAVHGLTTPGAIIQGDNPWVGFSAHLSLLVGAIFLALGSFDGKRKLRRFVVSHQRSLTLLFVLVMLIYGTVALVDSWDGNAASEPAATYATGTSVDESDGLEYEYAGATTDLAVDHGVFAILSSDPVSRAATSMTMSLLAFVAVRFALQYRRTRSALIGGFLASSIFLLQAQISMRFGTAWLASWWEYHVLMLAAFVAAVVALVLEYGHSGSMQGMVEGLLVRDTIEQLERGYGEVIAALVATVEAKDPYTRGHTQRVSVLSVRIAQELRLPPERVRVVGQTAMLHDIGKIAVPDSILNKPGRLTDEEFAIVKEHPVKGCEIIGNVRSLQRSLGGIRHHHERLDGSGYPDGLRGDEISLEARIIAVADVFDALTSTRSYRAAWSVQRAFAVLDEEVGSKLDTSCVQSLKRVVKRLDVPATDAAPADCIPVGVAVAAQD